MKVSSYFPIGLVLPFFQENNLVLTSKTTYYLNAMFDTGGSPTGLIFKGTKQPTIIRAVCAYL
jgi:hypothetical protein